jgi:hypothetical protein
MKYLPAQVLPFRCHDALLIGCVAEAMRPFRALPDREMAATLRAITSFMKHLVFSACFL